MSNVQVRQSVSHIHGCIVCRVYSRKTLDYQIYCYICDDDYCFGSCHFRSMQDHGRSAGIFDHTSVGARGINVEAHIA